MDDIQASELRLPLDLLLVHDVETLETAITAAFAIEADGEIYFCRDQSELDGYLDTYPTSKWYEVDSIESDRVRAVIDLLNKADEDPLLDHILDRIVR